MVFKLVVKWEGGRVLSVEGGCSIDKTLPAEMAG